MANNFLALGALAACGLALANVAALEPAPRPAASRAATTELEKTAYAVVNRNILETRQAPVPLIRNVRPRPVATAPPAAPAIDAETQARDDLDRKAAKAAVEADGYKRVTVLAKNANGTWRAKGYRGAAEVLLTVDGTGRVSQD